MEEVRNLDFFLNKYSSEARLSEKPCILVLFSLSFLIKVACFEREDASNPDCLSQPWAAFVITGRRTHAHKASLWNLASDVRSSASRMQLVCVHRRHLHIGGSIQSMRTHAPTSAIFFSHKHRDDPVLHDFSFDTVPKIRWLPPLLRAWTGIGQLWGSHSKINVQMQFTNAAFGRSATEAATQRIPADDTQLPHLRRDV